MMEVEAVRRRRGFRPYSSASFPIRVSPIALKIPPTCSQEVDGKTFKHLNPELCDCPSRTSNGVQRHHEEGIFNQLLQETDHA